MANVNVHACVQVLVSEAKVGRVGCFILIISSATCTAAPTVKA